jgi:hypothetical protein
VAYTLSSTDSAEKPKHMNDSGPLGVVWAGLGLCAFYIALIWVNTLLGIFLTPLFIIPGTWLMDKLGLFRNRRP